MFRNFKEYQDIAKIYTEKVSKPENLDENRNKRAAELRQKREENQKVETPRVKSNYQKNRDKLIQSRQNQNKGRAEKQFDFLKPKPIQRKPGATSVRQSGANDSRLLKNKVKPKVDTSKIDTSKEIESSEAEFKANEGGKVNQRFKKDVQIVKNSKMSGKERAQALAKKRIKSGKTIQQVKDANTASMKAKAAERNQKFQTAKKEGNLKQFRKDNPKLSGRERAQAMAKERIAAKKRLSDANIKVEDYTPYDIVLEYLLSTEQAATIEEANYVMTEMDGKTIKDIVEMQINRADIIGGTKAAKNAAAGKGNYTPGKGVTKDFKLDPNFKLPGV